MNGKKVTFKNSQGRMFREYFVERPYLRNTHRIDNLAQLFSFQHVLLTWLFCGLASCEIHLFFNSCSIFHQLNTKPNTIKSHKNTKNKIMQIQHFLSWNKVNIKCSCKSQLYIHQEICYSSISSVHIKRLEDWSKKQVKKNCSLSLDK